MTIERVRSKGLVWVTQIEDCFSEILVATRGEWTGLSIHARHGAGEMTIRIGNGEISTQNTSHRMFRPLVYGNCQSVIGRSRNGRQEKQLPEVWIFYSEGKLGSGETRIRAVERIQSISRKICHGGCMWR